MGPDESMSTVGAEEAGTATLFTTPSDEGPVGAPGTDQTDYATRLKVGALFAILFKLPSQRNEPTTCAVEVLSATAPHGCPDRIGGWTSREEATYETAGGEAWLMFRVGGAKAVHRDHQFLPSKVCDTTRPGHERG